MWFFGIFNWCIVCFAHASFYDHIKLSDSSMLKSAIQDIILTQDPHDATVIALHDPEDECAKGIVESVSQTIQRVRPLRIFDIHNAALFSQDHIRSSSRTIFFNVGQTWKVPDEQYLDNLTTAIRTTTWEQHEVKMIMILTMDGSSSNFTLIFEKMWKLKYLHFTIIELVMPDLTAVFHSMNVHIYNPFNGSSTVQRYHDGINWFPDKLHDMNGYQFRVNYDYGMPHALMLPNIRKENTTCPYDLLGFVGETLSLLANKMNFTIFVNHSCHTYGTNFCIYYDDNLLDMQYDLLMVNRLLNVKAKFIPTMSLTKLCLLTPRIYNDPHGATPWKLMVAVLVGLLIIIIYYLCARMMKFSAYLQHPINIFGIMMGIGLKEDPKKLIEKIMFISLVIASVRYASIFYAELVSASLVSPSEFEIKTFDDVRKSGLTAFFHETYYESTLKETNGKVPYVRRFEDENERIVCYDHLQLFKNVSCTEPTVAFDFGQQFSLDPSAIKMSSMCTQSTPLMLAFQYNSPYTDYMKPMMFRFREIGLPDVWLEHIGDFLKTLKGSKISPLPPPETSTPDYVPLHYLLPLYLISLLTFVAEVLWHRWQSKRTKPSRQIMVQPFNID